MSYFAQIDNNDIVVQVIRAEQDFINSGAVGDPTKWIQTSYNTKCGVHSQGGTPLRYNYASPGYTYDRVNDAFVAPRPYPSWNLTSGFCWEAPVAYPTDGNIYVWDESIINWRQIYP